MPSNLGELIDDLLFQYRLGWRTVGEMTLDTILIAHARGMRFDERARGG
ncbi:hypothetical protein SAMN05445850_5573 [Paraburkholderia tuberum]|uniref:Uncharacterized protein n=1 Tax=Paraburkholderia tuberum TaxID=157910 RepID=A0A1H1JSQ2_9BURK|nr:hypothetical protein SAMN05445850_5573 [Paraburkholderia tuberum]